MEDKKILQLVSERISQTRTHSVTLRMAPMIDMIFLLLLFFLVAAKWRPAEDSLPFRLPTAAAKQTNIAIPQPLSIKIYPATNGCSVKIAGLYDIRLKNETLDADIVILMQKLADCMNTQKRFTTDPIEISCRPEVNWQLVARIYNVFFGAGLTDITFLMTERTENDNPEQLHK